jgi:hypothetical protein
MHNPESTPLVMLLFFDVLCNISLQCENSDAMPKGRVVCVEILNSLCQGGVVPGSAVRQHSYPFTVQNDAAK